MSDGRIQQPFAGDVNFTGSISIDQPTTAATSTVSRTTVTATLLAANASRIGAMIVNESPRHLYVKFGGGASTIDFTVKIPPRGYYQVPFPAFTGLITGVWATVGAGAAYITETT